MDPINVESWLAQNRQKLQGPVSNVILAREKEFIVMLVAGPNERTDFHINQGEELFYQLKGDLFLKIRDGQQTRTVHVKEHELFLLPAAVPHSPQRGDGTLGLVIERERTAQELDSLVWYCNKCGRPLHEATLPMQDLVAQLRSVLENYKQHPKTCTHCVQQQ